MLSFELPLPIRVAWPNPSPVEARLPYVAKSRRQPPRERLVHRSPAVMDTQGRLNREQLSASQL